MHEDKITETFLSAASGGAISSDIIAKTTLSPKQFEHLASILSSKGLISILSDAAGKFKAYKTTAEGRKYLSNQLQSRK